MTDPHMIIIMTTRCFNLRFAMLGSRLTEVLYWSQQSKGGLLDFSIATASDAEILLHQMMPKHLDLQRWGGLDILVSNAAVNPYFGPILGCPEEVSKEHSIKKLVGKNILRNSVVFSQTWDKIFEVNVKASFLLFKVNINGKHISFVFQYSCYFNYFHPCHHEPTLHHHYST